MRGLCPWNLREKCLAGRVLRCFRVAGVGNRARSARRVHASKRARRCEIVVAAGNLVICGRTRAGRISQNAVGGCEQSRLEGMHCSCSSSGSL